jgi:hypothetical protein
VLLRYCLAGARDDAAAGACELEDVPAVKRKGDRITFTFMLEHEDGTPAGPPTLRTAVADWRAGDRIPLGRKGTLRVIDVQPGSDPDVGPVLVVERA